MREKLHEVVVISPLSRDHPRVCGKNVEPQRLLGLFLGSPPRVREKHSYFPQLADDIEDHPRVCGKNGDILARSTTALGSPPRVREKPAAVESGKPVTGITPACAGKTTA